MSAKSVNAVVPLVVGVTLVRAPPPEVYEPLSATSPLVVNAVVEASNVAVLSYKANLKVLPVPFVKSCTPCRISCLKLVHIKLPENAMLKSFQCVCQFRMPSISKCIIHSCAVTLNRLFQIYRNELFDACFKSMGLCAYGLGRSV